MEIMDTLIVVASLERWQAGLLDGLFWGSLAQSLVVAFVVALRVNRWLIDRGLGHAVVPEINPSALLRSARGAVAEWFKAAVLKTAGRKPRGFESLPLRQLPRLVHRSGFASRATVVSLD